MSKKRVVVTGMGIVSCFGSDVDAYYNHLLAGHSGIRTVDFIPAEEYPTTYAAPVQDLVTDGYIDRKLERRVDPFIRYAMVAGKRSLEQAGLLDGEAADRLDKSRCGAIMSSGMGGMKTFSEGVSTLESKGPKKISPFFIPYMITNMAGGLLAIDQGFMGPNYSISTACATANYSIIAAANHIRAGQADVMICGGAEAPLIPISMAGFVACKALSSGYNDRPAEASRPFDAARDGFVMGEGAGMLVLESLEHALERGAPILAEYLGGEVSCDAFHITAPKPGGEGMALCMEKAVVDAGISKERINYINAHATSTPVGDVEELSAVHTVFGAQTKKMCINATKSMIGHGLGASGGLEAVAVLKALETGKLHPTINLTDPTDALRDLDPVKDEAKSLDVDVALSNSFGFGGHNSSILLSKYQG